MHNDSNEFKVSKILQIQNDETIGELITGTIMEKYLEKAFSQ